MTKQKIKLLVLASYTKNDLDEKKVLAIAEWLSRQELKKYIKNLRKNEKKRTIYIEAAQITNDLKKISELFPEKKIVLKENPSLLAGIRITNNDDIFNFNVSKNLNDIIEFIDQ